MIIGNQKHFDHKAFLFQNCIHRFNRLTLTGSTVVHLLFKFEKVSVLVNNDFVFAILMIVNMDYLRLCNWNKKTYSDFTTSFRETSVNGARLGATFCRNTIMGLSYKWILCLDSPCRHRNDVVAIPQTMLISTFAKGMWGYGITSFQLKHFPWHKLIWMIIKVI